MTTVLYSDNDYPDAALEAALSAELTLGIVGLGRIGKRMAHISRNLFKRVVAYDPYLIDGDFPAYVAGKPEYVVTRGTRAP